RCVTYAGITPGTDTACIQMCDDLGICDTLNFYIHVLDSSLLTSIWVCDSVFVNQAKTVCIDTDMLPGDPVSIENFCEDEFGEFSGFFLDPVNYCVSFEGIEIGMDTACIEVCDEFGICDTTFFCISVIEYFEPPVAVDDRDTTTIGTPIVINIKENDTLFGGLTDVFILDPPLYGTIGTPGNPNEVNLDCSVTYNASDLFCEREDSFTYVVCTPNGCDTATVFIWIECIDIVIFTAVSPNDDGVNDVFYIANIEDFPENELSIYNRWGNLIYKTTGYRNDWDGSWDVDKQVPDGTYYYLLEISGEVSRQFSGYLELHR
ncbi:MAG: gliding motility-associated C-terminal domain-containing protein, partial [Bacteroidota bacterium]